MERYPGDEYVDLLGVDAYQYRSDKVYMDLVSTTMAMMTKIAAEHGGKFIALTETGYESIPNPTWWTDVLLPSLEAYPVSYVLTWRNACDKPPHYYGPWPGSGDAKNFIEFYNSPKTMFLGK